MKGEIKAVTINEMSFDIRKEGASLAIECQSIFMALIRKSNIDLDSNTDDEGFDMISHMTKDIVIRIKNIFIECVVSPKITNKSFEELPHSIIPRLFIAVYNYQTKEAIKKKLDSDNFQDSQTSSQKTK